MKGKGSDYYKELARMVSLVRSASPSKSSSYWISYAMGIGFDPTTFQQPLTPSPSQIEKLPVLVSREAEFPTDFAQWVPEDLIAVWNLRFMVEQQGWPSPFKAPARDNVGQLEWGRQGSNAYRQLYFKRIQEITRHTISSNLEGLIMPVDTIASLGIPEINLLAFGEFAFNPAADASSFFRTKISVLYGSPEGAKKLSTILELIETENGMQPQNKTEALILARQALANAKGIELAHWRGLIDFLENWKTP